MMRSLLAIAAMAPKTLAPVTKPVIGVILKSQSCCLQRPETMRMTRRTGREGCGRTAGPPENSGPDNFHARIVCAAVVALVLTGLAAAQEHVSFPTRDGWIIHA